jgi:hypothetical protein
MDVPYIYTVNRIKPIYHFITEEIRSGNLFLLHAFVLLQRIKCPLTYC